MYILDQKPIIFDEIQDMYNMHKFTTNTDCSMEDKPHHEYYCINL